ncbi:MAG: hypothetical protein Q9162_003883 [Coniocarpon cinnabarinum]
MPETPEERIESALSQLVERLQPSTEHEDEVASDERYFRAFDAAKEIIQSVEAPAIAHDENHIADLIRRRLVQENDLPQVALQFSNLFSRLLSRPVLNQKWAILYLLNSLSGTSRISERNDQTSPVRHQNPVELNGNARHERLSPLDPRNGGERLDQRSPFHARTGDGESRAFDETFSRRGLAVNPGETPNSLNPNSERRRHQEIGRPVERPRRTRDIANGMSPQNSTRYAERSLPQRETIPESALLRDLPFTLQGISSTNLLFPSPNVLKLPQNLPPPIISLLHSLAEPSLLYKSLTTFAESAAEGLIDQALRSAIGIELRSYLSLVASLEGQVRRALTQLEESSSRTNLGKAGVTLKRCVIWTREATLGLRLMSVIVEESRTQRGGQLISLIHNFASSHGDPFVGAFAERILGQITGPFYAMLRSWIYEGDLSDPYREFFVAEQDPSRANAEDNQPRGAATSVWSDKYTLNYEMIPSVVDEAFAQRVFLIGKSLNFIRTACGDPGWVSTYSKTHSHPLSYSDTAALSSSIDSAYSDTMSRLIHLMNTKFHLRTHLTALKNYLLLAQGDFVSLLMESLATNLDRPANSQYRHTLTAQLEHAIRGSNAQFDNPDVLRRLDARMLELSMGDIGWDVFTLEYKVDAPVDVIVTPHANIQYLKIFNFLWRVKRVDFALATTWRRSVTGARSVLKAAKSVTPQDWKQARCAIAEMSHFVRQLTYYILFEVIESAWTTLMSHIESPSSTLDDLIKAHTEYLKSITRKGLLASGGQPSGAAPFASQLHELLKIMLAYRDAVEGLYAICAQEAARDDARRAKIDQRTGRGQWGITDRDDEDVPSVRDTDSPLPPPLLNLGADGQLNLNDPNAIGSNSVDVLRKRLSSLMSEFRTRIQGLLGDLAHQPDPDLRFLGVVMNFNDFYAPVRRRRKEQSSRARDGERQGNERERREGKDREGKKGDDEERQGGVQAGRTKPDGAAEGRMKLDAAPDAKGKERRGSQRESVRRKERSPEKLRREGDEK